MRHQITGQILLIAFVGATVTGCTRPIHAWNLADPVMYANQNSGCIADASDCRYNTGLLLAVWPDGRILRAESADTIGLRYVVGSPSADQSRIVQDAVAELARQAEIRDPGMAPGSASHYVVVATDDGLATSWHFEIPVNAKQPAFIEERLISIMQAELENPRSVHWSELPRFDAPVVGNWRSVHGPR